MLTPRDDLRLTGVKGPLVSVVRLAAMRFPLLVLEGVRTQARQDQLYAQGRTTPGKVITWTRNSKHCTGDAVDIAPFPLDWNNIKRFCTLADHMFAAAKHLGVSIRWGGNWDQDEKPLERGESDLVHFEMTALPPSLRVDED